MVREILQYVSCALVGAGRPSPEHEEQGIVARVFAPGEFLAMITGGVIVDAERRT